MAARDRLLIPLVVAVSVVLSNNKSICGRGCRLGLLQDLLCRMPLPKWKPPFWLSDTVQVVAFVALVGGPTMADTYKENSCLSLRLWDLHRGLFP